MDKRLIFRYRSRTIQSQVCAGRAKPSAALELLRLTVQALDLRIGFQIGLLHDWLQHVLSESTSDTL